MYNQTESQSLFLFLQGKTDSPENGTFKIKT